ncbi:hypothetical protein NC652_009890 [Populus alba x Populus x berolinensis]|nr:hypothetical protein NC652_009890 [Populus alba x Populus x berolinensis]
MSPMGNGLSFLLDMEWLQTISRPPLPENWQIRISGTLGSLAGNCILLGS